MANPTTNYGWPMPTSTDLVTDLPADFAAFGQPVDTTLKALNPETTLGDISYRSATSNTNTRLGIGTNGQVLAVSGGVPAWTTTADVTPLTTKGDLFTFTTVDARLGVGTDGQTLVADSTAATGLKWATPASGASFVGVALYKTNSTNFTSATNTVIPWNAETFDTNTFHDNATNNTRITIPSGKAGYYLITAEATISSSNTSQSRQLTLWKNGTQYSNNYGNVSGYYNGVGQDYSLNFSYTINLAEADYLEVKYYQNSGVTIPCDQYNNYFTATYLGA